MHFFSVPVMALFIIFILPLVWSAVLQLFLSIWRTYQAHHNLGDVAEKFALLVMVLPVIIGFVFMASAPFLANNIGALSLSILPNPDKLLHESFMDVGPIEAARTGLHLSWPTTLIVVFLGIYTAPLPLKIWRLLLAQMHIRRILRHSIDASNFLGNRTVITEACVSPFANCCGTVVMPRILMNQLSTAQISLILAHEQTHITRRDPIYFLLLSWLEILFWLNPFVGAQIKHARIAAELACDARVLSRAPQMRKAYAQSIVLALKHTAGVALQCAPAVFSTSNKGEYRMRIVQIMQNQPVQRKHGVKSMATIAMILLIPISTMQFAYANSAPSTAIADNADNTDNTSAVHFPVQPVEGRLTSWFGNRPDPFTKRIKFHSGVDIAARAGTPIMVPQAGQVVRVNLSDEGYGNMLEIDHGDGFITRYGQLQSIDVVKGQKVKTGQKVAKVGSSGRSTGPHLHFEVLKGGKQVDPAKYVKLPARPVKATKPKP